MPATTTICGRVPYGTTPVFMAGAEFKVGSSDVDAVAREGFPLAAGGFTIRSDDFHTNLDATYPPSGYSFGHSSGNVRSSNRSDVFLDWANEIIMFCAQKPGGVDGTISSDVVYFYSSNVGSYPQSGVGFGADGSVQNYPRTQGGVSRANALSPTSWNWVAIHFRCHASLGFLRVYVDSQTNKVTDDGLGNTSRAALDGNPIRQIDQFSFAQSNEHNYDDIVICCRTLFFTGGPGTAPTDGATITDTTTGTGTCVVSRTTLDPTDPTKGILWVEYVQGTGFAATDVISDGAAFTATAANALTENGWWEDPMFLRIIFPTSDVSTDLTSSNTGPGTFADVNKSTGATPYSFGTADTNRQVMGGGTITTGFSTVRFVGMSAQAVQDTGALPNAQLGIDIAGSAEDSPKLVVNKSPTVIQTSFGALSPDTGVRFTEAEVNSAKYRYTIRS